jgi:hypothetical protein
MKNKKPIKTTMPTKMTFADFGTTVVLRTENHEGQTLAFLPNDYARCVAIDGEGRFEEAAKDWFITWFKGNVNAYEVNINEVQTLVGRLFILSIRKAR